MILDASTVERDLELDADVCIVGSGAGGSVVAAKLQSAGLSTVVLEDGPYLRAADFNQREEDMYNRLYRERGTQPTADFAVLVSQGRALGGSTLVGNGVCMRPPRQVLEEWRDRHAVSELDFEALFPFLEDVERAIGVAPIADEEVNVNNAILRRGSERLGFRGRVVDHNRRQCLGCGYCAIGCAYGRKADALATHLGTASREGARILPGARAERILARRGKVKGVEARLRETKGGETRKVRVTSPRVVLAAGALESPLLWQRSGLPDRAEVVGQNLRLHPQVVVAGSFEEPVRAWEGIPQSFVVDEFLNLDDSVEGGWLTFAASAQPVATAALLPGLGAEHRTQMRAYAHLAACAIVLHDHSKGQVRADRRGRARLDYELDAEDRRDVLEALRQTVDILFTAGANEVVLPYNDVVRLRSREAVRSIEERGILPNDPLLISFQPQGTLRMGDDPRRAAVDSFGAAHGVEGLWVADASVFPSAVAVPPQVTIMALAARTASRVLDRSSC